MHVYVDRIRDFINQPRRHHALYRNRARWLQLRSSLDVIGDAEFAIEAYTAGEFGTDWGSRYLALYGLLQALFLQQDAVFHLCESLGIPVPRDKYPQLEVIREIRNASTGHPTKKERPKPTSYHFIARVTLNQDGFDLLSYYGDQESEFKGISVSKLISDQRRSLVEILTSVIEELEHRDRTHKEQFKMEKLASLFPGTLSYHLGNIFLGINSSERVGLCLSDLMQVKQALAAFKEALPRRGTALEVYSLDHMYDHTEYALSKLDAFFRNLLDGEDPLINAKDAHIYAFFVEQKFLGLKQAAEEIDEEYAT